MHQEIVNFNSQHRQTNNAKTCDVEEKKYQFLLPTKLNFEHKGYEKWRWLRVIETLFITPPYLQ